MRIARVIDTNDQQRLVCEEPDGSYVAVKGDPLGPWDKTGEAVTVKSWLPPVDPAAVLCIGLNYRKHALDNVRVRCEGGGKLRLLALTTGCDRIKKGPTRGEWIIPKLGVYSILVAEN